MYARLVCTVQNKGWLVPYTELEEFREKHLKKKKADVDKDWYSSPFVYGEEAVEHFKKNKNSMSGYNGSALATMLYWDLDCEGNFKRAKNNAKRLVKHLRDLDLEDGLDIYFSGNKGFHVCVKIDNEIDQPTLLRIVKGIARDCKLDPDVFDTSVYNITRIFRMPNTKHQKSGLFKIPLEVAELNSCDEEEIYELAEVTRPILEPALHLDVQDLIEKYDVEEKEEYVVDDDEADRRALLDEFSDIIQDGERRRCIQLLEQGEFGPGERNDAIVRMAAYYKHEGLNKDEAHELINVALEARADKYDVNSTDDRETVATLNHVFSPKWEGGMFSCKSDDFLVKVCSQGGDCCMQPKSKAVGKTVQKIDHVFRDYIMYGDEADEEWPEFGLKALDNKVRIRTKNYSVFAGANGVGKTSLILQIIQNLNEQKIPHLFFSLDMANTSLFEKICARYTNYTIREVEEAFARNTRNTKLMREMGELLKRELPYTYFNFESMMDISRVKKIITDLNKDLEEPINMGFLDYAGRLAGESDSQYANATTNALMANDIVKKTNTHIMVISQISRMHGDHTTPIRNNRVAKESGAWEENATFVLTAWRPFGKGIEEVPDNYMVVYIGKNRTGSLGECYFKWQGSKGTLRDMSNEEINQYAKYCEEHNLEPPQQFDPNAGKDFKGRDGKEDTDEESESSEEGKRRKSRFANRSSGKGDSRKS